MTTFDDLLTDLRNESLLDEYFAHPFDNIRTVKSGHRSLLVAIAPQHETQINFQPPKKELVLPNFKFLKNNSDNFNDFDSKKLKKRFPVKIYTKSIVCQKCNVEVPFYIKHCRYCREKKVAKYFTISIYILVILLIVFITLLAFTI